MVGGEIAALAVAVAVIGTITLLNRMHIDRLNRYSEMTLAQRYLLDYIEILHGHGVKSQAALKFKEDHCNDPILMRRMRVMDHIFTMKEQIWEDQKKSSAQDKLARLVDARNLLG